MAALNTASSQLHAISASERVEVAIDKAAVVCGPPTLAPTVAVCDHDSSVVVSKSVRRTAISGITVAALISGAS